MSSSSEDTSHMSLDEYLEFLNIPSEMIESATENFADENLIIQGTSFKVYKGQLMQSGELINIVARMCEQLGLIINELQISKDLKHKNIVSSFKLSYEDHVIIINKHEANGSLNKHLSGSTLTWMRRLQICVGVVHALNYLHYHVEDNHHVIHGNIKSSKILLDHNWEPKLHGFAFAVKAKKHHLHLTSKYNGSLQYMDPAYENTRGLTHKSDVFSFGVVLFEILFGREASISNNDYGYFVQLARLHYEDKKLDHLIDPDLRKQMSAQSLNIFTETAYCCLKEHRSKRPDMNQVLKRLEKALEIQHQHEHSVATTIEGTSRNHLKGKNLDHLKIRLSDIELATNKFSKTYCIGSGGYGMVYKAELDHYDGINSSAIDLKNKNDIPKKHNTVAIKRIFSRVDGQGEQGFFAEIEMLSNCKHPNIISLLGFCDEGPEMILIYEYASNGSLDDYLGNTENITNLTWAQRIQICIDVAHGLNYLHTSTKDRQSIIHRDIKSANILLDDKWVAKIADFGLSKLHHACQQGSTLVTYNIAGTEVYLDPEYLSTGKLKTKSDIYSFGVVLLEIMCGKLAYDKTYSTMGLPSMARKCFCKGTLKDLVDPKIKEADEDISMLSGGVNQDSLETFSKITFQCLAESQSERPTMEVIIKELEKALNFQKNSKNNLHISLQAIKLGTQNFSDCNCIGEGRFWKLYQGEVSHSNGCSTVVAKRWDSKSDHGHIQFLTELEILFKYKHENIIGLVGYCNEMNEKIIVLEHASNGRLDKHLDDPNLTWTKRLKICINVANGLGFLHSGGVEQEDDIIEDDSMKHRDIKSGSILLDGDWNAKVSNFELCHKTMVFEGAEHVADNDFSSLGYIDPLYENDGFLTVGSDIYSLGVILLEMLCGRLAWSEGCEDHSQSLGPLAERLYNEKGSLDDIIFEGIKEHIVPKSLTKFQKVAIQCLSDDRCSRPGTRNIVRQLKRALEFQEDYANWEPRLPIDHKNIIKMSKTPSRYDSAKTKKNLYNLFSEGILLQDGKVWFSLGSNGERHEMISARKFSYKNCSSHKWRPLQESRFQKAAKLFDISKLNIQINITTQFLSPDVNYGAHLIFKFSDERKFSDKPMYVNLKYKRGSDSMHAYFATWRDDEWMMIELGRFLSQKEDTCFEVLLESFSRYYCGNCAIYIEGIEFRVTDSVKDEEIEKTKGVQQVLKSKSNKDQLLPLNQVNGKKLVMLSAKDVLYVKCFHLKPSAESRFQEVIELLPQQVFRINCKIQSQLLSPDTDYMCYLVFKISKKCQGLHCPVKVRNILNRNNKEAEILYFRPPSLLNLRDNNQVPEKREDGWMEVTVGKFNSTSQLKNDQIPINLKFITYEGTMSGLIVCGLEIWPM